MKLYAELPQQRFRQALIDAAVAAWSVIWVLVGVQVHDLVSSLSSAGRLLVQAGTDLERNASSVQDRVSRVPVVGSFLKERFEGLVEVGHSLRQSGLSQLRTVDSLSLWLGFLVALLPILLLVGLWSSKRLRWVRDASAAVRLRSDPGNSYLFALRAICNRPLSQLGPLESQILDFQQGRYSRLAEFELREMGLRYPHREIL